MGTTRHISMENKIQAICDSLTELAAQQEPHTKLPTIRELCEQFTTSRATLDDALAKLEILHVVYRKQGSGIYVSPYLRRKTICILLNASQLATLGASPFWGMLWALFAQEAQRRAHLKDEYHMLHIVVPTDDKDPPLPEEVMTMVEAGRIHGIMAIHLDRSAYDWLSERGIPYIAFAGYSPAMVSLDEQGLARLAVTQLVQQGCRKIGLWAPAEEWRGQWLPSRWHQNTYFRDALTEHQIPYRATLVRDYLYPARMFAQASLISAQEQGYFLAQDVFGDPDMLKPDGLFLTNDMLTDGVLAAFQALGIRVGEDVLIATHSNAGSMLSLNYIQGMSVIEYDPAEIVHSMFTLLDASLSQAQPIEQKIIVKPQLRQKRPSLV